MTREGSAMDGWHVFFSYRHADAAGARRLVAAMKAEGLDVWFDENEVQEFEQIEWRIQDGLVRSRALLAFYTETYSDSWPCQWELTAAWLGGLEHGDAARRVLAVNPCPDAGHVVLPDGATARFAMLTDADCEAVARAVRRHVDTLDAALGDAIVRERGDWHGRQRPLRPPGFVGRLRELWDIHRLLERPTTPMLSGEPGMGFAWIQGMGGVGKSLLALEYAVRFGARYPGGVFWLSAAGLAPTSTAEGRAAVLQAELAQVAISCLPVDPDPRVQLEKADALRRSDAESLRALVSDRIARANKRCLWVVDDLPEDLSDAELQRWRSPAATLAPMVVTSRGRAPGALLAEGQLQLRPMAARESFHLLVGERRAAPEGAEKEAAEQICALLGHHPLAVRIAGSTLLQEHSSFADGLRRLRRATTEVLESMGESAGELTLGHSASLRATLGYAIQRMSPAARSVLTLVGRLAPAAVPLDVVEEVLEHADGLDGEAMRRGAALAERWSLLSRTDEGALVVHAVVAGVVAHLDEPARGEEAEVALRGVLLARFAGAQDPTRSRTLAPLVPVAAGAAARSGLEPGLLRVGLAWTRLHLGQVGAAAEDARTATEALRGLLPGADPRRVEAELVLGAALLAGDHLAAAEAQVGPLVDTARAALGPAHEWSLQAAHQLAELRYHQGRYGEALEVLRGLVDGSQEGASPGLRVQLRRDAGVMLANVGDERGARTLLPVVVADARAELGEEAAATLDARLAWADLVGGREALDIARDVQARCVSAFGPDHPMTWSAETRVANALRELGLLGDGSDGRAGALPLHRRLLDAVRARLGPVHPDSLDAAARLGNCLGDAGKDVEAERLHREVLAGWTRIRGPEHPSTLGASFNLAADLRRLGRAAEARPLLVGLVGTRLRLVGPDHPDALLARGQLASLEVEEGRDGEALATFEALLRAWTDTVGSDHPQALQAQLDLAGVLTSLGRRAEARGLLEHVAARRAALLGDDHPATQAARAALAGHLRGDGEQSAARAILEDVAERRRRVLGPDHPATLDGALELAGLLGDQGEVEVARTGIDAVVGRCLDLFGGDHPRTLAAQETRALWELDNGDPTRAQAALASVLDRRRALYGPGHLLTFLSESSVGSSFVVAGDTKAARTLLEHSLAGLTELLGQDDLRTVDARRALANVDLADGADVRAQEEYAAVVDILRQRLGDEHPRTLAVESSLASVYRARGDREAHRALVCHVLDATRRRRDPEHPAALAAACAFGRLRVEDGEYTEAIEVLRGVVERASTRLGVTHPTTLGYELHLADALRRSGDPADALPHLRRVHAARCALLGPRHRSTVDAANALGLALYELGRDAEALTILNEVADQQARALGPDHPSTLVARGNLALVLQRLGRWDEARDIGQDTLDRQRRTLGADHPNVRTTLNNLGLVLGRLGEAEESLRCAEAVAEMDRACLGPMHPETLRSERNAAQALVGAGRREEARARMLDLERRMETVLGPEHGDTLVLKHNLAALVSALDGPAAAEARRRAVVGAAAPQLGGAHPTTMAARIGLALDQLAVGRTAAAIRELESAHADALKAHGPAHAQTVSLAWNLASALKGTDRAAERVALLRTVVDSGVRFDAAISTAGATIDLASALKAAGQGEEGERLLRSLVADESIAPFDRTVAQKELAGVLVDRKEWGPARDLAEAAMAGYAAAGRVELPRLTAWVALLRARAGDRDGAEALAREVLPTLRQLGDPAFVVPIENELADILVSTGRADEARALVPAAWAARVAPPAWTDAPASAKRAPDPAPRRRPGWAWIVGGVALLLALAWWWTRAR